MDVILRIGSALGHDSIFWVLLVLLVVLLVAYIRVPPGPPTDTPHSHDPFGSWR